MADHLSAIINRLHHMRDHILANPHGSFVFDRYPGEVPGKSVADQCKEVTNLGWLRRHHKDVQHPMVGCGFYVLGWKYGKPVTSAGYPLDHDYFKPILIAALNDGRFYGTQWQDIRVLHGWLKRPIFMHYTVNWGYSSSYGFPGPQTCAIGGKDYELLPLRRDHPSRWSEPERVQESVGLEVFA